MASSGNEPIRVTHNSRFVMIPQWIEAASAPAYKLYGVLMRYANYADRTAYPSRRTLAADMGFSSLRSVDTYVSELETMGAIRIHRAENQPNMYEMISDPGVQNIASPPVQNFARGYAEDCTPPVQNFAPNKEPFNEEGLTESGNVFTLPGIPDPSRAKKRRSQLPATWTPTDEHRYRAKTAGIDIEAEVARFRYYHEAKGTLNVNWNSAFAGWLLRAVEYRKNLSAPGGGDTPKAGRGAYAKFVPPTMEDMLAEEAELRRKYGDGS
jgi:hypothetical protein